jgi:ubiquinone/menaquinone biosynthesis C-methylase UbiE
MCNPPVNFDRLAPFYQAMEFLTAGGKLQRCRMEFLHDIPPPRSILLAGEGHGRSLPAFARKFPDAEITVVDGSARMLEIASRRVPGRVAPVHFIHADLLEWDGPPGSFDLVVTQFFLDCFPEHQLPLVVAKLASLATPSADWLLADFHIPESGAAPWRSRLIVWLLYRFFGIACQLRARSLHPPDSAMREAGFDLRHERFFDWSLLKSQWWRREERTGGNAYVACGGLDTGL